MPSKISQTAKGKFHDFTHVESKWTNAYTKSRIRSLNMENKLMVGGGEEIGKIDEEEWERQASSYRGNKSQESKVQHREYSWWFYNSVVWGQIVTWLVVSTV